MRNSNKGFTIVDVIVASAIIATLTVLIYPTVSDFIVLKKEGEEVDEQEKILRMIKAMSVADHKLPETDDVAVFAAEVSAFGNVPANDISEDVFRNTRYYRGVVATEQFKDASIEVYYSFLYGTGADGCWGKEIDCAPGDIVGRVDALLGALPVNYGTMYSAIDVPEGDYLIRYTDFKEKLVGYDKTVKRLNKLVGALSEYGRLQYYEGIAKGEDPNLIYYPPSDGPASVLFYDDVENDTSNETTESDIYGAGGSDVILNDDASVADKMDRRLGMIALTRLLGLPDEYCCSAMRHFTFNGEEYEEGFFYYSNPLARIDPTTTTCGVEPVAVTDRKLPPRITVEKDNCGKAP
ncbi:MAG: type II secretory pathway pseudopilin PulG [Alphaproteobacteria bacterium]|jgi:type II secretory pathway pseudopilin PulG